MRYPDEKPDIKSPRFSQDEDSSTALLGKPTLVENQQSQYTKRHLVLYFLVLGEFIGLLASLIYTWNAKLCEIPSVWSPAQHLVSHHMLTSTPYFYNRSPYLGNDTEKVDRLWDNLYDAGLISVISPSEASKLLNRTRAAPKAPEMYLVQLQVFHDLHCLNLIRKWVYMDVYPDQALWIDGKIDHDHVNALHVYHCLDALRQSVMCTSDITPRKFSPHEYERQYYVYPDIHVTQMCRNFDTISQWAKERRVVEWMMSYDDEWRRTRFNVTMSSPGQTGDST